MRTLILSFLFLLPAASSADLIILLHVPSIPGNSEVVGYEDWIEVGTMELMVDRELSSNTGGTQDINIGVGKLGFVKVAKALDRASAKLFQFAINGSSAGVIRIRFLDTSVMSGSGVPRIYLAYKMDRSFVKSMKVSSEPGEQPLEILELYYNRIASVYYEYDGTGAFTGSHVMRWDNVNNVPWTAHGIPTVPPQDGNQ